MRYFKNFGLDKKVNLSFIRSFVFSEKIKYLQKQKGIFEMINKTIIIDSSLLLKSLEQVIFFFKNIFKSLQIVKLDRIQVIVDNKIVFIFSRLVVGISILRQIIKERCIFGFLFFIIEKGLLLKGQIEVRVYRGYNRINGGFRSGVDFGYS